MIDAARPEDAVLLGPLELRVWLETYAREGEAWIREQRAVAGNEGRWREFLVAAEGEPGRLFCRVVRDGREIVGYLCGVRDEVVTLGPMYLLTAAQGRGLGDRLMGEFLAWAGEVEMRLWVTEYNERAVRFYERYGFRATGERELWRGRLPNLRMVRPVSPRGGRAGGW